VKGALNVCGAEANNAMPRAAVDVSLVTNGNQSRANETGIMLSRRIAK
jgi:hypothetical protein